jgi:hypothetical protein
MFMKELPHSSWNRWSQPEENFMLMKLCGLRLYMVNRKLLHSSLSMIFCDIVAFLLVRCISSLWDDDAEFCHMMHVNCGFLWIWMLDLIFVNLVISWLVPGCSPWWLPNPGWFQDATGKQAAGYCRGGLRICNECFLKLVTDTDHWSLSNGLQLEHQLQTCQQSTGHRKTPLPVLTGGPHNMARSSIHQRRKFTTRVSDIDFTVTAFVLVVITKGPCGPRETVVFTWPVTSCGNGCCLMTVTNPSYAETRVK